MKKASYIALSVILVVALIFVFVRYYSFIFSKTVVGSIVKVERVTEVGAVIGPGALPPSQVHSYAVAIKQADGEIVTASSEDRQWSVTSPGQCVEAKVFPYEPWDLNKSGTYHGARLLKLTDCKPAP